MKFLFVSSVQFLLASSVQFLLASSVQFRLASSVQFLLASRVQFLFASSVQFLLYLLLVCRYLLAVLRFPLCSFYFASSAHCPFASSVQF